MPTLRSVVTTRVHDADVGPTIKGWRDEFAQRRRLRAYAQGKLAQALGVDRNTVANWEAGRTTPSLEDRIRIAEHFGKSPAELGVPVFDEDTATTREQYQRLEQKIDRLIEFHRTGDRRALG